MAERSSYSLRGSETEELNRKIKIAHLLYSGQGGLGTYFLNFVRGDKEGAFIHYAFFYGIEPLNEEYREFCESRGIVYKYLKRRRKLDLSAFRIARAFIREHNIDYTLLHTLSLTPFYFALKHRVISFDHTPYQVKTTVEWIYAILNHFFAYKSIYFYPEQVQILKRIFPILRIGKNTHFIPKTVDLDAFNPSIAKSQMTHPFILGITARLVNGKRHDLLIEAISRLVKKERRIMLKIAGDGPLLSKYKVDVANREISEQIEFVGKLDLKDIIDFYHSLNAYIHASDGETICYSIMEAQASGLPILASNVKGINSVLQNTEDALLFENNPEDVVRAIESVLDNQDLLSRFRERSLDNSKSISVNAPALTLSKLLK